jgi:hypothetical protein
MCTFLWESVHFISYGFPCLVIPVGYTTINRVGVITTIYNGTTMKNIHPPAYSVITKKMVVRVLYQYPIAMGGTPFGCVHFSTLDVTPGVVVVCSSIKVFG